MMANGAGGNGSLGYFPREEYEQRLSRLEDELGRLGYETAVIWQRTGGSYDRAGHVYYLTNYASQAGGQELSAGASRVGGSFAALIVRRGKDPELHIAEPLHAVDRRYVKTDDIRGHTGDLDAALAQRLNELRVEGRVAYLGDDFLPAQMFRTLVAATPAIEWIPEEYLLSGIQSNKSKLELELYREAGSIATKSMTVLMERLIRGERQCDAVAKAAEIIIQGGGGFQRICCNTGQSSKLAMWDNPLYSFSKDAAQPGEMVRAWLMGPLFQGYWIDPGRTGVCGSPSSAQKRLIEDSVALLEHIMNAIRPGVTPREAGIVGDRYTAELGYGEDMGPAIWDFYGHGLSTFWLGPFIPAHGAESFEGDRGVWNVDQPFHNGQVLTAETFLYAPDVGTASCEEVFIVWDDQLERLTHTPLVFW